MKLLLSKNRIVELIIVLLIATNGSLAYSNSAGRVKSSPANRVPNPPTHLKALVITPYMIELNWTDHSDNEEGFKIFCNDKLIGIVKKNVTTFKSENLEPGKRYRFEVKAYNANGESAPASFADTTPGEGRY